MKKILIIEDEDPQRKILSDNFNQNEYTVLEAKDGSEGLQIALREHPDMILLDVRMPTMNGITMLHKLREDKWGNTAAVIVITNLDPSDSQLLQLTAEKPLYCLIKSNITLKALEEKVKDALTPNPNKLPYAG